MCWQTPFILVLGQQRPARLIFGLPGLVRPCLKKIFFKLFFEMGERIAVQSWQPELDQQIPLWKGRTNFHKLSSDRYMHTHTIIIKTKRNKIWVGSIFSFSERVCTCVCLCRCTGTCVDTVWKPENLASSSSGAGHLVFRGGLSPAGNSPSRLGWLANEP